jgi:hypothetical protein
MTTKTRTAMNNPVVGYESLPSFVVTDLSEKVLDGLNFWWFSGWASRRWP